mmetsp:Transcript_120556/g.385895  ORF Transcript_120556/g.385895 Transcript_120556/m.385895 type:complete len:228 (+) Transcript_120556:19-702(+)
MLRSPRAVLRTPSSRQVPSPPAPKPQPCKAARRNSEREAWRVSSLTLTSKPPVGTDPIGASKRVSGQYAADGELGKSTDSPQASWAQQGRGALDVGGGHERAAMQERVHKTFVDDDVEERRVPKGFGQAQGIRDLPRTAVRDIGGATAAAHRDGRRVGIHVEHICRGEGGGDERAQRRDATACMQHLQATTRAVAEPAVHKLSDGLQHLVTGLSDPFSGRGCSLLLG